MSDRPRKKQCRSLTPTPGGFETDDVSASQYDAISRYTRTSFNAALLARVTPRQMWSVARNPLNAALIASVLAPPGSLPMVGNVNITTISPEFLMLKRPGGPVARPPIGFLCLPMELREKVYVEYASLPVISPPPASFELSLPDDVTILDWHPSFNPELQYPLGTPMEAAAEHFQVALTRRSLMCTSRAVHRDFAPFFCANTVFQVGLVVTRGHRDRRRVYRFPEPSGSGGATRRANFSIEPPPYHEPELFFTTVRAWKLSMVRKLEYNASQGPWFTPHLPSRHIVAMRLDAPGLEDFVGLLRAVKSKMHDLAEVSVKVDCHAKVLVGGKSHGWKQQARYDADVRAIVLAGAAGATWTQLRDELGVGPGAPLEGWAVDERLAYDAEMADNDSWGSWRVTYPVGDWNLFVGELKVVFSKTLTEA